MIHRQMQSGKARGVDGVGKEEYAENLEANLASLIDRMKRGAYRPNPTRRAYIPKAGSDKMRPLGISCYEDKLVENAIAQILSPIYEQKFIATSYGFRPCRNCHMAVKEVIEMVQYRKTNYVVKADIRGLAELYCFRTTSRILGLTGNKMSKHVVTIGRWQYLKPDLCPDKEGNVVIIHKSSVAPSEIYEWGINVEKQAYERYQWCEDDFYDDGSYYHRISKKGLIEQIDKAIDLFVKEGFPDFANAFRNIKCILVCGDK